MSNAATRLALVREEISRSAKASRRDEHEISLIAVTKRRGESDIQELLDAGVTDFGESRVQEAAAKWPAIRARNPGVRLHMIGRLQSNKAAEAVELFDEIHSLDRPSLLAAVVTAGERSGRFPAAYIQVNIGDEAQKGGVAIADLPDFLEQVRASPIPLRGLMGIPPLECQPGPYFALLAELARRHGVNGLSMGMSGDYVTAVMLGATAIRIGTILFED